jgi:D-3-phosphoglycerate dehydrogenase
MKILITPNSLQEGNQSAALEKLKEFSSELVFNPYGRALSEEELLPLLKDCDGYIADLDQVTGKVLAGCSKLKVISRYGVGVDGVDLKAAKEKGILVTNTPGMNAASVAELAMGLILDIAWNISMLDRKTKAGEWTSSTGTVVNGRTLGILGLGATGKKLAKLAQCFSMKVIAYSPHLIPEYAKENNIGIATFDQVIEQADVISLHMPLSKETRHLINVEVIGRMKPGTILINTARGGIVDEEAAYRALKDGHLGGLGLDAFEVEPAKDSPLFQLDNVVVTPHTGSYTKEAMKNMENMAVDNLIRALSGKECCNIVVPAF